MISHVPTLIENLITARVHNKRSFFALFPPRDSRFALVLQATETPISVGLYKWCYNWYNWFVFAAEQKQ